MTADTHSESRSWSLSLATEGAIILALMLAGMASAAARVIAPELIPNVEIVTPVLLVVSIFAFVQWAAKGGMPPRM